MQSAPVVTLKSGQQNASSVDSKWPMHSFEFRTSSTLSRRSRVTSKPEGNPHLKLAIMGLEPRISTPGGTAEQACRKNRRGAKMSPLALNCENIFDAARLKACPS